MFFRKTLLFLFFVLILLGSGSGLVGEDRLTKSSGGIACEVTPDHAVTVGAYCDFLNAVAASDPQGLYEEKILGIVRKGGPGSYSYVVTVGAERKAVMYADQISVTSYLNSFDHTVLALPCDEELHSNLIFFEEVKEGDGIMQKKVKEQAASSAKKFLVATAMILGFSEGESAIEGANGEDSTLPSDPSSSSALSSPKELAVKSPEALRQEPQEAHQFVDALHEFMEASKTMACLRGLDVHSMTPEMSALYGSNQGEDLSGRILILNESNIPLSIPGSGVGPAASAMSIIPTIIPAGVKTDINGIKYEVPLRTPTAQENKAVRKLIRETFELYCGEKISKERLPSFYKEEHDRDPVTVKDLQSTIEGAEELMKEESNPGIKIFSEKYKISIADAVALSRNAALSVRDEAEEQKTRALFEKAYEELTAPEKALWDVFWYSAEIVPRTAAALGGHLLSGVVGSVVGGVVGLGIGCVTFGVAGGMVAAGAGATSAAFMIIFSSGVTALGVTGAALGFTTAMTASPYGFNYFAPDIAAHKAGEAFRNFRGESVNPTLMFMKEAQAADETAFATIDSSLGRWSDMKLEKLNSPSELDGDGNYSFTSFSYGKAATEEKEAEKAPASQPRIRAQVREILITSIQRRIENRRGFITQLHSKIDAAKERQQKADAMTRTADFRAGYPRGI